MEVLRQSDEYAGVDSIQEQIVALLPRLRRFARNLVRNPHDADDVVQIAVERALQRLDQWRSDARLDSWLFKIVRNAWIDEVRARSRRSKIFLAEEAGAEVGVSVMEGEIDRLSMEAAEVLDIPIGTLTSRLARGRDALQAMLHLPGDQS
jgi:RNA polymerase sigma-70 factor (ECF subfamily)